MGSKLCTDFYHQCIERKLCLIFSIHTLILAHPEILRCTLRSVDLPEFNSIRYKTYQHALQGMLMTCSMSRKGDCFDNAVVESFFANLKREECDGAAYPTRDIARQHVFTYLE